jgi:biopolymer transport protein ExbD
MSHGASDDEVDPNLTPLLDLVLQLLMFFIINVNFVSEQVNPDIKLPTSESARPIDKADTGALFLNQKSMKAKDFVNRLSPADQDRLKNQDSVVLVPGKEPMSLLECRAWLKDKYEEAEKLAAGGEIKTTIVFRPDADLELEQLFKLMNYCKVANFKKLKVRAIVKGGGRQ